ncbi:MAG: L-aspartate oxidase [Anaerovoracaceae bacterium]|jgi:L-aspartate oxidase
MVEKTDVIIGGTGVAGLFCALNLPDHINVIIVTKDKAEISDSYLAQGGIAALRCPEDYDDYFEDTMRAGHYRNNEESVRTMIKKSPEIIGDLVKFGVEFEKTGEGFSYTKEGGHSNHRILYHKDITGQEITEKLLAQVRKRPNVIIKENTTLIDIITDKNICKGAVVRNKEGDISCIYGKITVLATGGIGGLFRHSTNYRVISGDGVGIAMRHEIELKDVDYIQIHPTAFYSEEEGRRFLISESVRGEGAILLNPDMERFVDELQPRDVVATAIKREMEKFGVPNVFLSLAHLEEDAIKKRFPNIYDYCMDKGYDFCKDPIPVTPAQHYFMGGIRTDLHGRTSMENLFAIGETSCNGVHGANRLGSNSLLEALVFSQNAAEVIKEAVPYIDVDDMVMNGEDECSYEGYEDMDEKNRDLIFNEIRKRNREFYELWCRD